MAWTVLWGFQTAFGGLDTHKKELAWTFQGGVQIAFRGLGTHKKELVRRIRAYDGSDDVRPQRHNRASAKEAARRLVRGDPKVPGSLLRSAWPVPHECIGDGAEGGARRCPSAETSDGLRVTFPGLHVQGAGYHSSPPGDVCGAARRRLKHGRKVPKVSSVRFGPAPK